MTDLPVRMALGGLHFIADLTLPYGRVLHDYLAGPHTIQQAMSRHKDIRYSSRAESHTARQRQIHHLRHVVRELGRLLPERERARDEVKALLGWGCATVMHVLPLRAPRIEGEDHAKDIDFTPAGIRARWEAGRDLTRRRIAEAPWRGNADAMAGILVHD